MVAACSWAHSAAGQSQAVAAPEPLLCGDGSESGGIKSRVLVGRFPKVGDVEQNSGQNLEYGFKGSLVAGLLTRNDAAVHVWGNDAEQLQRFKSLEEQINNAFVGGSPRDQQRRALAKLLRTQNCQYLLGGRISQDADAIGVTLYRLEAETATVRRSSPVFGDVQTLMRSADRFAAEFGAFLHEKQPAKQARLVEAGCISVPAPNPVPIPQTEIERLAATMRDRLAQGLAQDKRLLVKPVVNTAICGSPENASDNGSLVVSAELGGGKDTIEIRPMIRISDIDGSKTSIALPILTRPVAEVVAMPAYFAEAVHEFLFVTMRKDGSLPEEFFSAPQEASDRLWNILEQDLQDGNVERVALTAYRILASNPDNAFASYMLGRAFLSKQQPQLALEYFLTAKQRTREGWSAERLASLNEFSGEAQRRLRRASDSEEYFREARTLYAQAGKQNDSARAGRSLAVALFVSNQKDKASEELRSQPGLGSDVESLRLLGLFAALSDEFSNALEWYKLALKANPSDRETQTALADAYEALGKKELAAKRYQQSRVWFEAAIEQRPDDGRRIYLATLPAYQLGDFADVALKLERVINGTGTSTSEKLAPAFVDAVWLTLFESYLLLGRYQDMDQRFDAAAMALGPDARLLMSYFRFCGQAIGDPSKTSADLEKSPLFQSILNTPQPVSGKNVAGWNNENVDAYLKKAELSPDKRALVERANDRVLPAKLP